MNFIDRFKRILRLKFYNFELYDSQIALKEINLKKLLDKEVHLKHFLYFYFYFI